MTTTAAFLVESAAGLLHDKEAVRWTARDHVLALNMAQRELVRIRPDQKSTVVQVDLVEGFRQYIPDNAFAFIGVPNNATGRMRRVSKIDEMQLDSIDQDWRSRTKVLEIVHFLHDLRDPREYWVYPPAKSGAKVDLSIAKAPIDIPLPAEGVLPSAVAGVIDLADVWSEALLSFMLFKAYSKDAEFGGNAGMATGFMNLFNAALGVQLESTTQVASTTK